MKCRNGLTKQWSKYSAWTVPVVPADIIHTEIACVGKMQIFVRSNIRILYIYNPPICVLPPAGRWWYRPQPYRPHLRPCQPHTIFIWATCRYWPCHISHIAVILFVVRYCSITELAPLLYDDTVIIRPHRSTTYVDASYCYRSSSMVCQSVCLSVCHTSAPCKNGCTDWGAVWVEDSGPWEPLISWGSRSPDGKGQYFGVGKGRPIEKYRVTLWSSMQERLNRSRCRLACGMGWAQGIMC